MAREEGVPLVHPGRRGDLQTWPFQNPSGLSFLTPLLSTTFMPSLPPPPPRQPLSRTSFSHPHLLYFHTLHLSFFFPSLQPFIPLYHSSTLICILPLPLLSTLSFPSTLSIPPPHSFPSERSLLHFP